MKKNILKSVFMAAPTLLLLAACQSEPEVGSTLYPSNADAYEPVAYIDNHAYLPKNMQSNMFVQKGSSPELDTEGCELKFKVHLTAVSDKDLTFNVKIDNSKIPAAYAETHEAANADAFKIETGTVTVKAGKMESEEAFDIKLDAASKTLQELSEDKKLMAAFTLEAPADVKLSDKYNAYCWEVNKAVFWVNPKGTTEGLQQLDVKTYDANGGSYGGIGTDMSDGNDNTSTRFQVGNNSAFFIKVDLKQPTDIKAIQLTPADRYWGESITSFFPKEIEILGSTVDKDMFKATTEDFVRLGVATCPAKPSGPKDKWDVVFFGSQKVRHIWIKIVSSYRDDVVFINELRLFK